VLVAVAVVDVPVNVELVRVLVLDVSVVVMDVPDVVVDVVEVVVLLSVSVTDVTVVFVLVVVAVVDVTQLYCRSYESTFSSFTRTGASEKRRHTSFESRKEKNWHPAREEHSLAHSLASIAGCTLKSKASFACFWPGITS
jgi:hypothetical protein